MDFKPFYDKNVMMACTKISADVADNFVMTDSTEFKDKAIL